MRLVCSRMMWFVVGCLMPALALGWNPGARAAVSPADMILLNGKIVTVNPQSLLARAVAIQQGKIVAVGTTDQIRPYAGQSTRVIDLRGRTVIPGLIDSHIHAIRQGQTWDTELHWQTVTSLAQGFRMIRDRVARTPPGTWIVVAGGWHESQFAENRRPTAEEIEVISADHPIWMQYLNDETMVNKAGIRALGITAETKDPAGGKIIKDPSGQPTGVVTGTGAITALSLKIPQRSLDEQIMSTPTGSAN